MAYLRALKTEDPKRKLGNEGPESGGGGESVGTAGGAPTTSGSWDNIGAWLNANQGQGAVLGQKVAGGLQKRASDAAAVASSAQGSLSGRSPLQPMNNPTEPGKGWAPGTYSLTRELDPSYGPLTQNVEQQTDWAQDEVERARDEQSRLLSSNSARQDALRPWGGRQLDATLLGQYGLDPIRGVQFPSITEYVAPEVKPPDKVEGPVKQPRPPETVPMASAGQLHPAPGSPGAVPGTVQNGRVWTGREWVYAQRGDNPEAFAQQYRR